MEAILWCKPLSNVKDKTPAGLLPWEGVGIQYEALCQGTRGLHQYQMNLCSSLLARVQLIICEDAKFLNQFSQNDFPVQY